MEMMLLLLLALTQLPTNVYGITCFSCLSSNETECRQNQQLTKCKANEICLTMQFKEENDGRTKEITSFQKGCGSLSCSLQCNIKRILGATCKSACCYSNVCNRYTWKRTASSTYNNVPQLLTFIVVIASSSRNI